jgi:acyl-CoA dehydrogenase
MADSSPADPAFDLPFFAAHHAGLASRVGAIADEVVEPRAAAADAGDPDQAGREFAGALGRRGLLELIAPDAQAGRLDLRAVCLAREQLAARSALADAVFAVQGLGAWPIATFGSSELRARYVEPARAGTIIGAFALTEPSAGSDVGAICAVARRSQDEYAIDGVKTLISNAAIADFFVLFAATDPAAGRKGLSAFVVDRGTPGLRLVRSIPLVAPHPIGELEFTDCRVPAAHRLGAEGDGLRVALATLDTFRPTVGAAACGLAGRALREALRRVTAREQFGAPLASFQATRFALAEMATDLDAARLLVYRAAWLHDAGAPRITREASMAKLHATEAAQRIVDRALQLHGGAGLERGAVVERLYREVRALRIYEGTSEIQHLVIAEQVLRSASGQGR